MQTISTSRIPTSYGALDSIAARAREQNEANEAHEATRSALIDQRTDDLARIYALGDPTALVHWAKRPGRTPTIGEVVRDTLVFNPDLLTRYERLAFLASENRDVTLLARELRMDLMHAAAEGEVA